MKRPYSTVLPEIRKKGRFCSLDLVRQPECKLALLCVKTDLASHPAQSVGIG